MNQNNENITNVENKKTNSGKKVLIRFTIISIIISILCVFWGIYINKTTEGLGRLGIIIPIGIILSLIILNMILWGISIVIGMIKKDREKGISTKKTIIKAVIISAIIISIPFIPEFIKMHSLIINFNFPEIVECKTSDSVPKYVDYLTLGQDLNEYDVYNNIEKYKNQKVLVSGFTTYYGNSDSVDLPITKREIVNILNKEEKNYNENNAPYYDDSNNDKVLYRFVVIDKGSMFSKDNYTFGHTPSRKDYYLWIYGKISGIDYEFNGGENFKVINIKPEKIYYSLDKFNQW